MNVMFLNPSHRFHLCNSDHLSAVSLFNKFVSPTKSTLVLRQRADYGSCFSVSVALYPGVKTVSKAGPGILCHEETKERIRKLFNKVELSISPYDTAWVAMVPSPQNSQAPHFPECVSWLLDNQLGDGSWSLHHPSLDKDALLSTLACVLALKRWSVGEEHINKALHFIQLNISSAMDNNLHSPIGFDIIFSGMIEYAKELDLNIPLELSVLRTMLQKRDLELRSHSKENIAYLAYVSEGIGKSQDWDLVMKYQRKNGSLFNSPSTTAAALIHLQDVGCLNYLHSVLEKYGNSVPTIYPLDIYSRLCMVDNLEQMGIDRHFREEINNVLNETHRFWLQHDEEIFMDITTCAMAFRLLRTNGYDVSSDPLIEICNGDNYLDSLGGHFKEMSVALELYKASQIIIYTDESALEKQKSLASHFLKQKSSRGSIHSDGLLKQISLEVADAFEFPFHANLERLANRRNIEHYNLDGIKTLKTSCSSPNFSNKDFLRLAVEDFNTCQSIQREELKILERWVVENNLEKLKFARQKLAYCYFSAAATLFSPELSDARISWAKNAVLTTIVDDFFDIGGSMEELVNLIELVQRWDVNIGTDCCSEQVKIIFSALHGTICEIGLKACTWQSRSVTGHIIDIWLDLLDSMLREAEWSKNASLPTIDEYMENGYISFALGPIVLPALYFVGPKLSKEVVHDTELRSLYKLMSTCGRLLNDVHSYERESKEGKLNAVSLRLTHGKGSITEEVAIREMKKFIDSQRTELLKLVLEEKGNVVPKACKDVFWKMSKVLHLFYAKDDGFTSNEMLKAVKLIIHEPISFNNL